LTPYCKTEDKAHKLQSAVCLCIDARLLSDVSPGSSRKKTLHFAKDSLSFNLQCACALMLTCWSMFHQAHQEKNLAICKRFTMSQEWDLPSHFMP